jgi:hypothetical protein
VGSCTEFVPRLIARRRLSIVNMLEMPPDNFLRQVFPCSSQDVIPNNDNVIVIVSTDDTEVLVHENPIDNIGINTALGWNMN